MAKSTRRFAELLQEGISAIVVLTSKPKSVIRDELGYAIGRKGGSAIEYWGYGDGHIPKQQSEVEALARVLVDEGQLDQPWLTAFLDSAGYPDGTAIVADLFPKTPDQSPDNLPLPPTPFVGRADELDILLGRLQDPSCRLLTLVGPGGFGKTRLVIRLGELLLEREHPFVDGIFFVALDGLENGDLVVPAIAAALQFTFYEHSEQQEQLMNYLDGKQLLLILDSAEQILTSELTVEILKRAPQVKLAVTSRESLNLQQEWIHPIGGLLVTDPYRGSAQIIDAVRLFQQSAIRSNPGFDLDQDLDHVQQICRLVGGAPLAIELAAAWLRALPCAQLAQELAVNLDFLSTSQRDIPARHRSMRAVLEQTWQYLTDDEQQVFRRLSVFVDGFRADAAESVASASLWMLAALVEKSILQFTQDGRYRIHPLLRQLGAEKLATEAEELRTIQSRHGEFYLTFLRDRRDVITGPDQRTVLEEVQEEIKNVRKAWMLISSFARLSDIYAAMPALFRFLWMRGRYEEGEQLMAGALLELNRTRLTRDEERARIVLTARRSQFAAATGEFRRADLMLVEALEAAEDIGSLPEQALCLRVAGMNAQIKDDGDLTVDNFKAAYELYQKLGDRAGRAETALHAAHPLFTWTGDYATSQVLIEESMLYFREIGDISSMADSLDRTASTVLFVSGEVDRADVLYQESLSLAREAGHRLVVARSIGGLSLVAARARPSGHSDRTDAGKISTDAGSGLESEVCESQNLLCGVYVLLKRYEEAALLANTHPVTSAANWVAEAHVVAGAYGKAMSYLPSLTTKALGKNTYYLAACMVPWAILLTSDCPLEAVEGDAGTTALLPRSARFEKAVEILSLLSSHARCWVFTRRRANELLTALREQSPLEQSENTPSRTRSIEELAQEMLAIRIRR